MTKWLLLAVLGGSLLLIGLRARRRWLERADAQIDAEIAAKRAALDQQLAGQLADESLTRRAAGRRASANDKRRQAHRIESGQTVDDRIRMVGGR